jgi:hypothetical protein
MVRAAEAKCLARGKMPREAIQREAVWCVYYPNLLPLICVHLRLSAVELATPISSRGAWDFLELEPWSLELWQGVSQSLSAPSMIAAVSILVFTVAATCL